MRHSFGLLSFMLGATATLALGCFMGARSASSQPEQRYDAFTIGAAMLVTDHQTNTLYMYDRDSDAKTFNLSETVDLSNVGKKSFTYTVEDDSKTPQPK